MAAREEPSGPMAKGRELLFLMEIADGFTFRGLIEILCHLNVEGLFVFTPAGCQYVNCDTDKNIIVSIAIEKRFMLSYKFNSTDRMVPIYVSLPKFKDTLKSVVRHDNLLLYQYADNSNLFVGRNNNDDEQYIMTLDGGVIQNVEEVSYRAGLDCPSYVISTEDLSKKFSTIGRNPGAECQITLADEGSFLHVNVDGHQGSGSSIKINQTQSGAPQLKFPQRYQLTKPIIKFFSKIQSLYKGPVQLYTEEDKPLKITCPVGTYGVLHAYILNVTDKWTAIRRAEQGLRAIALPKSSPAVPRDGSAAQPEERTAAPHAVESRAPAWAGETETGSASAGKGRAYVPRRIQQKSARTSPENHSARASRK
jgi:hypothetical protein